MNHTSQQGVQEWRAKSGQLARALEPGQEDRGSRGRPNCAKFVVASPQMQQLAKMISRIGKHSCPVVILGESGTGKELVARSIHESGPRAQKPFVPVDCAALTATLIESELFGHLRGAFTGADHATRGLFEAANEGTLFLDEIGELPLELQAKLLRVLQEKEIRHIGSTERIPIDVRVIAATNCDLEEAVRGGTFRKDLYFRLNVVQIKLPPLRERRSAIPPLVSYFLEKFSDPREPVHTVSDAAMRRLISADWPGNVRELENAVERAVALGSDPILDVGDLFPNPECRSDQYFSESDGFLRLEEIERHAIFRTLRATGGDKLAAASQLGIGVTTLYRRLRLYKGDS